MDNYIYINNFSIPLELCNDIIEHYNNSNTLHYRGVTGQGLNLDIKDTFDLSITEASLKDEKWNKIKNFLFKELNNNLQKYSKKINLNKEYNCLPNVLSAETLQMQKYEKGKGKYTYHNDFSINYNDKMHRTITYLWYLNNVEIGGETEINGNIKIKPETGKLLLFPACWTYPHCGIKPISHDKYIITGWVYSNSK
jgi:hypothetical protein